MWQALLAAAVAGSGFLANRFLTSVADPELDQPKNQPPHFAVSSEPQPSTPPTVYSFDGNRESEPESQSLSRCGGGGGDGSGSIFRFSSSAGIGRGGKGGNRKGLKNGGGFGKAERKYGKKFVVCVKKRRTSKSAPGKCDACSSKENSIFSWGLSAGIMYMMSAGKAEINKLNMAMDDTAKIIQELKAELSKQKSFRHLKFSSSWNELSANSDKIRGKHIESVPEWSAEDIYHVQDSGFLMNEEGECASVLTEEPQQEAQQMDHLEAELESELQKLSWTSGEASGPEGNTSDMFENHASAGALYKSDGQNCNSYQLNGVLPSELDKKLSHLLIEQQGSHIVELESELHHAQSKLHEKEAELQALKDCIRRLTDLSLATASDEENETQIEEENANDGDYGNMGTDSKKSVVGMKRAMAFVSYSCRN